MPTTLACRTPALKSYCTSEMHFGIIARHTIQCDKQMQTAALPFQPPITEALQESSSINTDVTPVIGVDRPWEHSVHMNGLDVLQLRDSLTTLRTGYEPTVTATSSNHPHAIHMGRGGRSS